MCRSARDGGLRCASATRPAFDKARADLTAAERQGLPPRMLAMLRDDLSRAAVEHAAGPDGHGEVKDALTAARLDGNVDTEVLLEGALARGRDRAAAAEQVRARAGKSAADKPDDGTVGLPDCTWMPEDSVEAAEGLLRVYEIDPTTCRFTPAALPVRDLDPSSLDDYADDLDGYVRVEQMTADYADGQDLPPLLVIRHPDGWPIRWTVVDGLHRLSAANDAGLGTVNCLVVDQPASDPRTFR